MAAGLLVAACAGPAPSPSAAAVSPAGLGPSAVAQPTTVASPPSPSIAPATANANANASPTGPALTPVPASGNAIADRILAILDAEAGDLRLELDDDIVADATQLDGTVDDGSGPGRLLVVVFPPGRVNPGPLCLDRDFAQGGTCVRVDLGGGEALYRRGLVEAAGTKVIVATLQRADGSGVLLESGNFRIELPPVLVGNVRPTPELTRDGPVFTLDELAGLARAIGAATRDCTPDACP